MKQIFFTSKNKKEGIDTDDVIKLFENSDDLDEIKRTVENAEDRLLVSWASVEMKDHAGELIPIEDIIKQQDTLLERNGPMTDEHTNRVIGETLAYKVMEHPETKSVGVLHLDKTFSHNEFDDKIWGEIQSGERKGLSVGGFNTAESKGVDDVTGEEATVLEGFKQFETASVKDPCNPMALTEAYSVVAKSKRNVVKPAELDRCVQSLMEDPDFKPEDSDQTKEQAAFAVCNAQIGKKAEVEKFWNGINQKKESNINKLNNKNDIQEGDTMKEATKKTISEMEKKLKILQKEIKKLKQDENLEEEKEEEEEAKKQDDEEKPEEEKKKTKEEDEPEEKKKQDDDEEEEKKKKKQDEDEEEKVKKEEAKGDIEGEEPALDQPESPEPDDVNDTDVYKEMEKKLEKKFEKLKNQMVTKVNTPRPGGDPAFVKKAEEISNLAMDLAQGKKKMTWSMVHKKVEDMSKEVV